MTKDPLGPKTGTIFNGVYLGYNALPSSESYTSNSTFGKLKEELTMANTILGKISKWVESKVIMTEYNWSTAPTICEVNGVRWALGPEAEDEMDWHCAIDWCKSVGGVLPPREVLLHAYLNKDIKDSFVNDYYWSSSENDSGSVWYQNFFLGTQNYGNESSTCSFRAVRAFKIGEE